MSRKDELLNLIGDDKINGMDGARYRKGGVLNDLCNKFRE